MIIKFLGWILKHGKLKNEVINVKIIRKMIELNLINLIENCKESKFKEIYKEFLCYILT